MALAILLREVVSTMALWGHARITAGHPKAGYCAPNIMLGMLLINAQKRLNGTGTPHACTFGATTPNHHPRGSAVTHLATAQKDVKYIHAVLTGEGIAASTMTGLRIRVPILAEALWAVQR